MIWRSSTVKLWLYAPTRQQMPSCGEQPNKLNHCLARHILPRGVILVSSTKVQYLQLVQALQQLPRTVLHCDLQFLPELKQLLQGALAPASDAVDVIVTDRMLETWKVNEEAEARDAKRAKSTVTILARHDPSSDYDERLRTFGWHRLSHRRTVARVRLVAVAAGLSLAGSDLTSVPRISSRTGYLSPFAYLGALSEDRGESTHYVWTSCCDNGFRQFALHTIGDPRPGGLQRTPGSRITVIVSDGLAYDEATLHR
ncbi:hypothetical protein HPB47_013638 [Ixodes persulcatus]|uniref:Uncharacterized protein n=1 Tax=Ixodes persulcatus TaxID=34615 RepID=A0AC60QY08_IXOPE|nr:hypothetical protein HPB47_013638 [Ixodes persulcatus]